MIKLMLMIKKSYMSNKAKESKKHKQNKVIRETKKVRLMNRPLPYHEYGELSPLSKKTNHHHSEINHHSQPSRRVTLMLANNQGLKLIYGVFGL